MPVIPLEHTHSVLVSSAGFSYTVTQPASVAIATGTAASDFVWTGGTGGTTSIITTGTGGAGTDYTVTTGNGGVASAAATASTGGRGGDWTVILGNGGGADNAANLGTNQGGRGGTFTRTAGNGGDAANGTGNTPGAGGDIIETAGDAGSGGNANGGSFAFTAGRASGSGTEGSFTVVTGGSTRLTIAGAGNVTIAAPDSGTGLTVSGGGINVVGASQFGITGMRVGLGSGDAAHTSGIITIEAQSAFQSAIAIKTYAANERSTLHLWRAKGTYAIPTAITADGDDIGQIEYRVYNNSDWLNAAYIRCEVDGTPGAADAPARFVFLVSPSGSSTPAEALRIASNKLTTITGQATITGVATAGGATALTITPGAHTAMTSTEKIDVNLAAHSVTFTDGQTLTLARSVVFGATTYVGAAAGGTETVTTAITAEFGLPVQGANLTMTNAPISARFLGNVVVGNILTPAAGPTNTLSIASGTAPTEVVADSIMLYSSDDAVGHTIPSFWCEGTNVLATGQADSASATRVKMRINGTVVTLLAI